MRRGNPDSRPREHRSRAGLSVHRRIQRLAFGLVALGAAATLLVACAPQAAQTPASTSPVVGIVMAVDSPSLGKVNGFTLRETASGTTLVFKLGVLENATVFSPSHLAEHMASSEPIRVFWRMENGDRVAYRLEDAST